MEMMAGCEFNEVRAAVCLILRVSASYRSSSARGVERLSRQALLIGGHPRMAGLQSRCLYLTPLHIFLSSLLKGGGVLIGISPRHEVPQVEGPRESQNREESPMLQRKNVIRPWLMLAPLEFF